MERGKRNYETTGILVLVLVLGFCSQSIFAQTDFELFVEDLVKNQVVPLANTVGLGVTVVNSSSSTPIFSKGFGHRDLENNLTVDAHTLFPVGSITKSIVSVLVVKILNEKFPQYGENALEYPVKHLFQNISSNFNWTLGDKFRTETISFRDLLAHRACLTGDITGAQYGYINTTEDFLFRTRYEKEVCGFRTFWVYNNAMYVLASRLIAEIAGQPFETLMENLLLELGMTSTRLSKMDEDYTTLPNMTQPYYIDENGNLTKGNGNLFRQVSIVNAAGGAVSTLNDMSKYISFHLNTGTVDGKEILPKAVYGWLTRIAIPVGPGLNYGLGLLLRYVQGAAEPLISHDGYYPPYMSQFTVFPHSGIAIFSASSGPGFTKPSTAQTVLHNGIINYFLQQAKNVLSSPDIKFLQQPEEQPAAPKIEKVLKKTPALRHSAPEQVVGVFGAAVQGEIQVSFKNETAKTLKLTYGSWGEADLIPTDEHGETFQIKWTSDIVLHHFSMADGRNITNILQYETLDKVIFWFASDSAFVFERNFTLSNLPEIPWKEDEQENCETEGGGKGGAGDLFSLKSTSLLLISSILVLMQIFH